MRGLMQSPIIRRIRRLIMRRILSRTTNLTTSLIQPASPDVLGEPR
jgi:hypothetical protein